jgi:hypothetical protein
MWQRFNENNFENIFLTSWNLYEKLILPPIKPFPNSMFRRQIIGIPSNI